MTSLLRHNSNKPMDICSCFRYKLFFDTAKVLHRFLKKVVDDAALMCSISVHFRHSRSLLCWETTFSEVPLRTTTLNVSGLKRDCRSASEQGWFTVSVFLSTSCPWRWNDCRMRQNVPPFPHRRAQTTYRLKNVVNRGVIHYVTPPWRFPWSCTDEKVRRWWWFKK